MAFLCAFETKIFLNNDAHCVSGDKVYVDGVKENEESDENDAVVVFSSKNDRTEEKRLGTFCDQYEKTILPLFNCPYFIDRMAGHIQGTTSDKMVNAIFRVYGPRSTKREIVRMLSTKGISLKRVRYPRKNHEGKNQGCPALQLAKSMTNSQELQKDVRNAWIDLSEAVPYLTEFFRTNRKPEDKDIVYFLQTTTDYVHTLNEYVARLENERYSPNQEGIVTREEAEYNYGDSDSDETLDYESD